MQQIPHNIAYALDVFPYWLSGENEEYEEFVASFAQRWGGIDAEALGRAVNGEDERHRLFALLALGYTASDTAHEVLLPFLKSEKTLERWFSALELVKMREPQALPILLDLLTEFDVSNADTADKSLRHPCLFPVPSVLGAMGNPTAVPFLRRALEKAVDAEAVIPDAPPEECTQGGKRIAVRRRTARDGWVSFQDEVVFALGRLGAFGALSGIQGGAEHLYLWRVHLIMGHLHGQYPVRGLFRWQEMPELLRKVARLLEQCFGVGQDERATCLSEYEILKGAKISGMYETERLRMEGRIW